MSAPHESTTKIKLLAEELGFFACGIAPAAFLAEEAPRMDEWLSKGYHSGMHYMTNHREKRLDPAKLLDGARSVIVMLYNYFPSREMDPGSDYLISRYAYGTDYHDVIREKLNMIVDKILEMNAGIIARGFVDSAPVLERAWAARAGLGWIGKNAMLISKRKGSYFFIAEIITNLELEYDDPFGGNYCGDCSRCIDSCPTGAIVKPYIIDSGRCISYLTIENKGYIPEPFKGEYKQWIFGCDICQQVCPWNQYSVPAREPAFQIGAELLEMESVDWETLEEEKFRDLFRKSPVKRAKFEGLKRNIAFLQKVSSPPQEER